jgi:very-short-patch-repair endonuclease
VTCAKCGLENLSEGAPCPRCAPAPPQGYLVGAKPTISEDFLLGSTRIGLERIRARLLDLTNRNKLLNFRHTLRSSLSVVGVLPDFLFDTLIESDSVSFRPVPQPKGQLLKPKVVDYARQIGLPTSVDLPELSSLPTTRGNRLRQVQTLHYPDELEAILRRISYVARTAIEESGMKMLHLIFGFLEWYESDNSDQSRLAPLLLVPVTIEKARADPTSGTFIYEIAYSSADEIEENLSLREKLKRDFGLDMPELSEDETPESYFRKFQGILSAKPKWRLRRRVTLGLASFAKLLMFRDLDPKTWPKESDLIEHPRISDFFEGTKAPDTSFADEYEIDALEEEHRAPPLVHDADSSQHSALLDATSGKNLVIEGPPGTGKSQTITNLIALAIADGKTVLFVSEKLAALEVVRRRLDQAGLGVFCLELHSHKTDKRKLLDELEERLKARGSFKEPKDLIDKQTLLQRAKEQLVEYAALINEPFSALGCTGFDVIWRRETSRHSLRFDPGLVDKITVDRSSRTRLSEFESDCAVLDLYGRQLTELRRTFPDLQKHPWRNISNTALDYSGERELCAQLEAIKAGAQALQGEIDHLASMTSGPSPVSLEAVRDLLEKCNDLPEVKDNAAKGVLRAVRSETHEAQLRSFLHDVVALRKSRDTLTRQFPTVFRPANANALNLLRLRCEKAIEQGLGSLDRSALRTLEAQGQSLRVIMKDGSPLDREVFANGLSVCERSTILSRLLGRSYRRTTRVFKEYFLCAKRPRLKEITHSFHRALLFAETLKAYEGLSSRHPFPLTSDALGIITDGARELLSLFEQFDVHDGQNSHDVSAAIAEYTSSGRVGDHVPARQLLGEHFNGIDTDLEIISAALGAIARIRRAEIHATLKTWLLASDSDSRLSLLQSALEKIATRVRSLDQALTRFSELGQSRPQAWWGPGPWMLQALERTAETSLGNSAHLSGWMEFQRAARDVKGANLAKITNLAESRTVAVFDLVPAYKYIFFNTLALQLTKDRPRLFQFSGLRQDAVREQFVQLDKELIRLNRQRTAVFASRHPVPLGVRSGPVAQRSELALVEQEIAKKRRHIPIRQLVRRAGRTLQALKPCFMMGPLSVAQYIAAGQLKFDLVVMDEASQLKPEDALGAIARGAQLVVVGDPKQLPPSTFFERQFDIDSDDDQVEETSAVEEHESILDVATALYQPVRQLRWHYRSRHDSLIAFSNVEFYRSRLLVFPSPVPKSPTHGIHFRYVTDGVYEAGQAKWNRPEAVRVVNAIVNHTRTCPELSLGVVALNYQQRELIEELWTERTRKDETLLAFVDRHREASEPFFIKNLENVQGDERDVIFISVTYGRDKNGNLFQRFGPINQTQGPRRLNVLFTRAKYRVVVFSSIDPDDLRADSSTPRGVAVLKAYLTFAKSGRLDTPTYSDKRELTSDFEIAVSSALAAHGLDCEPQIGVAGFFIDIGVRHPRKPGAFILGIECDGASYHSAKSARDRDRLRQTILENLGWSIHRIWSTDWFRDRRREIEKVIERIQQLLVKFEAAGPDAEPKAVSPPDGDVSQLNQGAKGMRRDSTKSPENKALRATAPSIPARSRHKGTSNIDEARERLIHLRESVLKGEFPNVDPARGLLRKSMLDALLLLKPRTRQEWLARLPYALRTTTDPEQVGKYLDAVLEIISDLNS